MAAARRRGAVGCGTFSPSCFQLARSFSSLQSLKESLTVVSRSRSRAYSFPSREPSHSVATTRGNPTGQEQEQQQQQPNSVSLGQTQSERERASQPASRHNPTATPTTTLGRQLSCSPSLASASKQQVTRGAPLVEATRTTLQTVSTNQRRIHHCVVWPIKTNEQTNGKLTRMREFSDAARHIC